MSGADRSLSLRAGPLEAGSHPHARLRNSAPTGNDRAVVAAVATSKEELTAIAGLATRQALQRGGQLVLIACARDAAAFKRRVPPWLQDLADTHDAETRTVAGSGNRPFIEVVRTVLAKLGPSLVVVGPSEELRPLLAFPITETLVAPAGAEPFGEAERVLVVLPNGERAGTVAATAAALVATGGELVLAGIVQPRAGKGTCEARERALRAALPEALEGIRTSFRIVRGRSHEAALLSVVRAGEAGIVVTDAEREALIPWSGRKLPERLLAKTNVPVVVTSRPVPTLSRRLRTLGAGLYGLLPSLSDSERVATYSTVRRLARGGVDFTFMVLLSTAIAALGLRLDSPAIVIGAMLVAPFMAPIVAIGMGVAEGDSRLVRISALSVARGTVTVLAVGLAVGLLIPPSDLTGEMLARSEPAPLDLLVALASGAAGAYAMSRKSAASALPGAAIAVSLVPPLATAGIALAIREQGAAAGASLLFLLNFAAVSLASSAVFLWIGFKPEVSRIGRLRLFGKGIGGLSLLLLVVSLPVGWLNLCAGDGTTIEEEVGAALNVALADLPDVELRGFAVTRERDGTIGVRAEVGSPAPLEQSAALGLQLALGDALERPVALALDVVATTRLQLGATTGDLVAEP